ncbi:MAG: flagellar basal body rod protein FlgC [Acidimicrobiia bacterium]
MGMFAALDSSASGTKVSRIWLDAIADNVANVNTVRPFDEEPFRARLVVAQSYENGDDRGAQVAGIVNSAEEAALVWDPDNPYADQDGPTAGMVRRPVVDLAAEMTNMLIAQRSYQANLSVMDRVRDAYKSALSIGVK